jgi:hypothetical protein
MAFGVHAMTNSWGIAVAVTLGFCALTASFVVALVFGQRHRQGQPPKPLRRVGIASRVLAVVCGLLGALFLFATLGTDQPRSHRVTDVVVGGVCALIAILAATGTITRTRRLLGASLPTNRNARSISLIFIVVGILALLFAAAGYSSVTNMRRHGVETAATITAVTDFRAHTYFLQYTLPSGRVVHCSTENVRGTPDAGETITVLYDSASPSTGCQSADYGTSYAQANWSLGIGAFIFAAGCVIWYLRRTPRIPQHQVGDA